MDVLNEESSFLKEESRFERRIPTVRVRYSHVQKFVKTLIILHTIRKVKFLSKNSILTKPQHFLEFFTQILFDNFSCEIKFVNR